MQGNDTENTDGTWCLGGVRVSSQQMPPGASLPVKVKL